MRDENRVGKWLEDADESVEIDKPGPVPEVNWKVPSMLIKEGRQAPRMEELHNEAPIGTEPLLGLQDDDKKQTKDVLDAMMELIRRAFDASLTNGIKLQKISMLR